MVSGLAVGGGVPGWLSLERAVPLFLLAELVRVVKSRPALNAAVIGAAAAVVGARLPLHGGVLVGAVAGVTAALVSERGGS
jgi:predicted branched-subunit amino acid permease